MNILFYTVDGGSKDGGWSLTVVDGYGGIKSKLILLLPITSGLLLTHSLFLTPKLMITCVSSCSNSWSQWDPALTHDHKWDPALTHDHKWTPAQTHDHKWIPAPTHDHKWITVQTHDHKWAPNSLWQLISHTYLFILSKIYYLGSIMYCTHDHSIGSTHPQLLLTLIIMMNNLVIRTIYKTDATWFIITQLNTHSPWIHPWDIVEWFHPFQCLDLMLLHPITKCEHSYNSVHYLTQVQDVIQIIP